MVWFGEVRCGSVWSGYSSLCNRKVAERFSVYGVVRCGLVWFGVVIHLSAIERLQRDFQTKEENINYHSSQLVTMIVAMLFMWRINLKSETAAFLAVCLLWASAAYNLIQDFRGKPRSRGRTIIDQNIAVFD
jgi:hypothetical protein